MEQEPNEHKLDLTETRDDDTDDDDGDVEKHLEVGLCQPHAPGREQDGDGRRGFEHLDEGDAEV